VGDARQHEESGRRKRRTHLEQSLESWVGSLEDSGEDEIRLHVAHRLECLLRVGNGDRVPREHGEESDGPHRQHELALDLRRESPFLGRLGVGSLLFRDAVVEGR
jgi:hypothetical protein